MILLILIFGLGIFILIMHLYAQMGKNLNHPSPGMAYFIFIPFVLPVYVAQLARAKGLTFGGIIVIHALLLFGSYINNQNISNAKKEMVAAVQESIEFEGDFRAANRGKVDIAMIRAEPEFQAFEQRMKDSSATIFNNKWELPLRILVFVNFIYVSYLLLLATKAPMIYLCLNLIPGLGFLIIFFICYLKSKEGVPDDEVDPTAIFNGLPDNEKKITLQIIEALKSPNKPSETVIMTQVQSMGIDPDKAELITALAFEVDKLNQG